ncbi:acyltransferase family protein [Thalassotalea atypica]|uniref:acyltransferase family protein n=1 Tax=Thalassotalea atypica TaxID=2054316 RepID=UPI0025733EB7|nr:acyltransferase [Thalassotalea atypica]
MNRKFSVYLDFIRFAAALAVFVSHVPGFAGGWLWQVAGFGHEAVVIFFVLSGFVISYVVFEKQESAIKYTVSRLSRIYSVAIPALFLTLSLYYLGQEVNQAAFVSLNEKLNDPILTLISAFTFTNQSWLASPVFSNLPYWSLGYEVLYYLFFGILVYSRGNKRVMLLGLVCLLMGPSILLYLPIWLAGVFCFKKLKVYNLSFGLSLLLYSISIIGIVVLSVSSIQSGINTFMLNILGSDFYNILLEPAEKFVSDYVLALFVTLHIFSSYHLINNSSFLSIGKKVELLVKEMSSHTFSLYLYHMPILYFISALFPYDSLPILNLAFCWFIVPLLIFLISNFTEKKKHRYAIFFNAIFTKFSPNNALKSDS